MIAMRNLLPPEFLRDRSKVQQLVQLFDPVVRAVDGTAGEAVSMRVHSVLMLLRNAKDCRILLAKSKLSKFVLSFVKQVDLECSDG
ncbi:hypothetical protein A4A49_40679 [Nicotiana attenuata]|uniref:Uncharacterized protein n=1 Tax=Nicotiana attenuata TaxID=49451 RepID=A0A314KVE6_NICAT|nr:hypothetical protein A4A49_40679 [Nicotiana attenuata]